MGPAVPSTDVVCEAPDSRRSKVGNREWGARPGYLFRPEAYSMPIPVAARVNGIGLADVELVG
jgi:hypothetical protein